jgi:hypothetical protein
MYDEARVRLDVWTAAAITALFFAGGMFLRFRNAPEVPPRPRPPAQGADIQAFRALDYSSNVFRAQVERDAASLAVPADPLTGVLEHHMEAPVHTLAAGEALETRDLRFSLRVARLPERGRARAPTDHLILRIENRTAAHLAYRVVARPPIDARGCVEKEEILHNAIALAPREAIERTECGRSGVTQVVVALVETMRLPPLSYHYVSWLHPVHIGLDARAAKGHRPREGVICGDVPEQAIRRALETSAATWRDVIDFYARHDCRSYIFHVGYRAFATESEHPLPVRRGSAAARP